MRHVALVALLLLAACPPSRRPGDDEPLDPVDAGPPTCTGNTDCGAHGVCDATRGTCGCAPGFHACGSACLSNDAPESCGDRCSACPADPAGEGVPECVNATCGVDCGAGRIFCGGACVACNGVCANGACRTECGAGTHRCGARCAADDDALACGEACVSCAAPSGSGFVGTCEDARCVFECPAGTSPCRGACVAGTCAWTRRALAQAAGNALATIDAQGQLQVAWAHDGFGTVRNVTTGTENSIGLCDGTSAFAMGPTPRGFAAMCAEGNFQDPLKLTEFTSTGTTNATLRNSVQSVGGAALRGNVGVWLSDSYVHEAKYEAGGWSAAILDNASRKDIRAFDLLDGPQGPVLAYVEQDNNGTPTLKAIARTRSAQGTWSTRTLSSELPHGTRFGVRPDGKLVAAWTSWNAAAQSSELRFGTEDDAFAGNVVAGDVDAFALAVDAAGTPRLAWVTKTNAQYALRIAGFWHVETVWTGAPRGVQLVVGPTGAPTLVVATWTEGVIVFD